MIVTRTRGRNPATGGDCQLFVKCSIVNYAAQFTISLYHRGEKMAIISKIKEGIKKITSRPRPIAGGKEYLIIIKDTNGELLDDFKTDSPDIFRIINFFNTYSDYKILYDLNVQVIKILFTVKKSNKEVKSK